MKSAALEGNLKDTKDRREEGQERRKKGPEMRQLENGECRVRE